MNISRITVYLQAFIGGLGGEACVVFRLPVKIEVVSYANLPQTVVVSH